MTTESKPTQPTTELQTRAAQGIALATFLVGLIIFILGFAHTWRPEGSTNVCFSNFVDAQFPKWIGCAMAAHENLAGGLIGAAGTIFAAWLAWIAIDRQLNQQHQLAQLSETNSFLAVKAEMRDILQHINEIWRTFDWLLLATPDQLPARIAVAATAAGTWPTNFATSTMDEFSKGLPPNRRREFTSISSILGILNTNLLAVARLNIHDENARHSVSLARILMSHLNKYLQNFDADLHAIFQGRTNDNVNHQNMAAHVRPFVDQHVN